MWAPTNGDGCRTRLHSPCSLELLEQNGDLHASGNAVDRPMVEAWRIRWGDVLRSFHSSCRRSNGIDDCLD